MCAIPSCTKHRKLTVNVTVKNKTRVYVFSYNNNRCTTGYSELMVGMLQLMGRQLNDAVDFSQQNLGSDGYIIHLIYRN